MLFLIQYHLWGGPVNCEVREVSGWAHSYIGEGTILLIWPMTFLTDPGQSLEAHQGQSPNGPRNRQIFRTCLTVATPDLDCSFPSAECQEKCKCDPLPHSFCNSLTLSVVSCQLGLSDLSGKLLDLWQVVVDFGCLSLALHNERKHQAAGKDCTWKIHIRIGVKLKQFSS